MFKTLFLKERAQYFSVQWFNFKMKTNSEFLLSCPFTYFPHKSKVEMCIFCFTYLCYCLNFSFLAQRLVYSSLKKSLGLLTKNRPKTPTQAFSFAGVLGCFPVWGWRGLPDGPELPVCIKSRLWECGSERNFMEWLWVMQLQNQLGWIESLVANFRNSRKMKMLRLIVTQMFSPADWHISVHSSWSVFGSWAYLMI